MRLPSGQDVARAMGVTPLTDDKILIGKFTGDKADIVITINKVGDGKGSSAIVPSGRTCWRRLSVSADTLKTLQGDKKIISRRLGPVGGQIVAETAHIMRSSGRRNSSGEINGSTVAGLFLRRQKRQRYPVVGSSRRSGSRSREGGI
jgi:hypothetical protein